MMTAMRNTLKKINRTVLETDLGILFLGVLAQIIGAFIAKDKMMYQGACGSVSCLRLQQHIICTVPWTGRWISRRRPHRR